MYTGMWPKEPLFWRQGILSFCSIPFTWNIKKVKAFIKLKGGEWYVGGPACHLMPEAFSDLKDVYVLEHCPDILQRHNPYATRTTRGCPNTCQFCAIGKKLIEPEFYELSDWENLPVICDNNLLAASEMHLARVFRKLKWWGWADFNQGLDCRKITKEIAEEINNIGKPLVRISLDSWNLQDPWLKAVELLKDAGIPKRRIQSYVMIGYGDVPGRDIARIQFAKDILSSSLVNAMWFHELDAMKANIVTDKQSNYGWTERLRIDTMRWSYGKTSKPNTRKI